MTTCSPVTIVYRDRAGLVSIRNVVVQSIERCQNGNTIVRAYDNTRQGPRSFTLDRIYDASFNVCGITVALDTAE
jgi:predicted DNA-binding transcriptional regulator YafY